MTKVLDKPANLDATPPLSEDRNAPFGPLTAHDRCEATAVKMLNDKTVGRGSCEAQAFIRAIFAPNRDLVFCKHHGQEHRVALVAAGAYLHSEIDKINEKASQSSA